MHVQTYYSDGLPAGRERLSRAQKAVTQGHGEWLNCFQLSKRYENLAKAVARAGNSIAADAYYRMASNVLADAEAGADDVVWLFRPSPNRGTSQKTVSSYKFRMEKRREVGVVIHNAVVMNGPDAVTGREQERMFSAAGCDVSSDVWKLIVKYRNVCPVSKKG